MECCLALGDVAEYCLSVVDYGDAGVVTGCFDGEDVHDRGLEVADVGEVAEGFTVVHAVAYSPNWRDVKANVLDGNVGGCPFLGEADGGVDGAGSQVVDMALC